MSRLERLLMLATNLAVLAGLAFVAFEFRQNREAIEIQQQLSVAEVNSQINLAIATDPDLAALVSRAASGDVEALSDADHVRLRNWVRANLEPRLGYYFLRDSGFMVKEDWCNFMRYFATLRSRPYFSRILDDAITYASEIEKEIAVRCEAVDAP